MTKRNIDWMLAGLVTALTALPAIAETADDSSAQQVLITASRLGDGLIGASTTVITSEEMAQDPAADLPSLLSRQAGVQIQQLFGGVNGAQSAVGLRGFGSTASENTLILVNGRRVNDPDQSGIDFSAIPAASIERIEITRGNAAAVLYGDGAVGGVINIVTKNGDNAPASASIDAGFGSFQYRSLDLSTNQKIGGTSLSAYGSEIVSNGYRDNNAIRERNFDAELRQDVGGGQIYLNLRGDDQHLGLPGALPLAQEESSPKSTNSPQDWGDLQSINATLGGTQKLADGIELVIDAGLRHKEEQTVYNAFGGSFYGINLTTASFTPRLNIDHQLFGFASKIITGVDLYQSWYRSYTASAKGAVPYDNHLLSQRTEAIYAEDSVTVTPDTQIGFGLRLQRADLAAREKADAYAPGYYAGAVGTPLNQSDNEYAAHFGIEQRIAAPLTLFARIAHAMRMPNMDDRNYVAAYPTDFRLKTQTSNDVEIGLKGDWGRVSGQTSLYAMDLHNEIDYDPGANFGFGANTNLDPTRRLGSETEISVQLLDDLRVTGAGTVTQATFRDGPYKGQGVPQVALLSGNLGIAWDIWREWLALNADIRETGRHRLGDDFTGAAQTVPAYTQIDLKLSGKVSQVSWSLAAHNLFDVHSYDLGYASSYGPPSVYPLPGRDLVGRVGVSF